MPFPRAFVAMRPLGRAPARPAEAAQPAWWAGRSFAVLALACAVLPLLPHAVAPLVDLPGHIGRYRILADAAWLPGGGPLARHWAVRWGLVGNLGVDALVVALHPLLDVEPAARLVVTAIPALTMLAMLWLGREAHGRVPAGAPMALPLAYAFPFQLGFVNFCLAQAMAFAGLALWLRLSRTRPPAWRLLALPPVACLTWAAHSFGWAMLGLFVWAAEWAGRRERGQPALAAAWRAALMCVPMGLPLLASLAGPDAPAGDTGDWFRWTVKAQWAVSILRERWRPWDAAGVALVACVLWAALRSPRLRFAPVLGVPALGGAVAFLCLPRMLAGGSYVDMRMLPAAVALALLAIRPGPGGAGAERRLAWLGAGFLLARTAGTTLAFAMYANGQAAALAAVPHLPAGGAVLVLVNEPSSANWSQPRLTHIAGLGVARARVFTNEQWALPGQQPIRPLHPRAAPLDRDPSQLVYPRGSEYRPTDLDAAIRTFDRCTFDAVWTVRFPPGRARAADLRLAWSDGTSAVYRVNPAARRACR